MAVDREAELVPFCLPHAVWAHVWQFVHAAYEHTMDSVHTLPRPLSPEVQQVVDTIVIQTNRVDAIAHTTQQLLDHHDCREIRDLFALMQLPMPAPLVQLFSPLAPY